METKGHRVTLHHDPRHIEVRVGENTIASSRRTVVLDETGLPPRHYFPRDDVRLEHATPTSTSTHCPFKGQASYFTFDVDGQPHVDLAWSYEQPIDGMEGIAGLVCFFDERVDTLVDGESSDRPLTPWSETG